ncbi:pre-rRNA-processing protein TSR4 [Marchantia polymorpha subsp. ruderalis]|uniref:MYND-type domain-containing protein n=2 Tax=Marchantia polymorpha TaxID=3197 RepID=A0A176WQ33_MARPO|nr:hypothetical protein AXG93_1550s1150 [Marchantia polymorpha subsp. ruderalis]PTQ40973.1 hypothetical protein MARPO_0037s0138 [Marchantia polymorpha]BBN05131.1 hypothetical protein Mp_3g10580 [Marchantia polymorpha subsp. ruderalis]|eukprot:PTQ40973.1 hypothetical protein MARPO_0037s0138 [Marchantia polymorpha]
MAVIEDHSDGDDEIQTENAITHGVSVGNVSEIGLEQTIASLEIVASDDVDVESGDEEDDGEEDEIWGGGGLKGFVSKPEHPWKLLRQYFPSKAGGAPAWLDPMKVPPAKHGSCGICDKPLQFVLQVYAPSEDDASAFHRTLFVFVCTSLACLQQDQNQQRRKDKPKRSVKVFRSQLPRENDYYSASPPLTDGSALPLCKGAVLCSWCGTWKGDKICGGCKETRYCSQTHQMDHWRGGHAPGCRQAQEKMKATNEESCTTSSSDVEGADGVSLSSPACPSLWPEFELIVEDHSDDEDEDSDEGGMDERDGVRRLLSEYENRRRNQGREEFSSKDVAELQESSAEEQQWAAFQARVSKTPGQVLWYLRSADAKPLWPRVDGQPKTTDIPQCSHCGGNRIFEFQILPQLLYYFQLKDDPDSLDWGTIAVYSCENSCTVEGGSQEFAWVQPGFA